MTIEQAPYYWVVCDGCGRRMPAPDGINAWQTPSQAEEVALGCLWEKDETGEWACETCVYEAERERART